MKVSSYIKINKSANEVLNLIKSPNNLEKFHPYCISNKVFGIVRNQLIMFIITVEKFIKENLLNGIRMAMY